MADIEVLLESLKMSTETPKNEKVKDTCSSPDRRLSGNGWRKSLTGQFGSEVVDLSHFDSPRDYERYRLKKLVEEESKEECGQAGGVDQSDLSRDTFSDVEEFIEHRLLDIVGRARRSVGDEVDLPRGHDHAKQPQAHSTPKTPDSFSLDTVPENSHESVATLDLATLEQTSLDDMGLPKLKLCSTLPIILPSNLERTGKLKKRVSFANHIVAEKKDKDHLKTDSPWPGKLKNRSSLDMNRPSLDTKPASSSSVICDNHESNILPELKPKSRIPLSKWSHKRTQKVENDINKSRFVPQNRTSPVTINPMWGAETSKHALKNQSDKENIPI